MIGRRDAIGERVRALLPWAALFVAYAGLYTALGFGVHASGAYVDPIRERIASARPPEARRANTAEARARTDGDLSPESDRRHEWRSALPATKPTREHCNMTETARRRGRSKFRSTRTRTATRAGD